MTKAGKYKLSIAYASEKDRDMDVTVNGKLAERLACQNTGSWSRQWSAVTVTVSLRAGSNQVRIGNGDGAAPNIDYMRVEKL